MKNKVIIASMCALLLTGCISREQADARLVRGCTAAAEIFLDEGYSIKSVKQSTFSQSKEFGAGFRTTDLTVIESDDWAELEKEIECTFAENMGPFGTSHSASLYQLKINDEVYGIQGGNLLGDMETHIKLINAVDAAIALHK